jgi:hypothetical protein
MTAPYRTVALDRRMLAVHAKPSAHRPRSRQGVLSTPLTIDLTALPDDPNILQQMLREAVPELQAENEKLWLLIQRLLLHRYGPR